MKKLFCLALIVILVVVLVQNGMITSEKLATWGADAISWTIDTLAMLLKEIESRGSESSKEDILLVNADHPLPDSYSPGDLVRLYEQKRSFLLARDDLYLTQEAFEAAEQMFAAAESQGMNGYIITSAYRSREAQQKVYDESEPGLAQMPGCSEHETGLAFDVTVRHDSGSFEDTEQCQWLLEHCHEYGFIQRYPEGKEAITGVKYEPWHYRYVGTETAQKIHDSALTLEEYLGS